MIITYLPDVAVLQVVDDSLTVAMATATSVEATATLNCGTEFVQAYSGNGMTGSDNLFYWLPYDIMFYFNPSMWGLESFVDGVYRITIKVIQPDNSYIIMENCLFVDITIKCKVAILLDEVMTDKTSTLAHMLHYSLVNGSNCGCNCDAMCENFNTLMGILNSSTAVINNDCGCW